MREHKKFGKRMSHSRKDLEKVAKRAATENKSNPYDPIFGLKRNDKVIFHIRWRCNNCGETFNYIPNRVFTEEALCLICKTGILEEETYYAV